MALNQVGLVDYHGKWLTEAEILLCKLFEVKHEERASELRAKKMERDVMAQRSLTVQQLMDQSSKQKKAPPAPEPVAAAAPLQQKEPMKEERVKPEFRHAFVPESQESTAMEVDEPEPAIAIERKQSAKPAKIIKKKALLDETELEEAADAHSNLDPANLFSTAGLISDVVWKSTAANSQPLNLLLPGFSFNQKQTLGIKLTVPNNLTSWSLNICLARDWHSNNILLHFNPRYNPRYKNRTVITNDKQGTWGAARSRSIAREANSKNEGLLAKEMDLMIQLRPDGFYIFANEMFCDFFPHRRDPTGGTGGVATTDLRVIVLDKDANGNAQDVIVNKVWWGRRDPSNNPLAFLAQSKATRAVKEEKERISRMVPFDQRSLLIRGLPMGKFDLVECQAIEYALQEVFTEFGVEDVSVVPGQGYCFMRLASASSVQPSISEFDGATMALSEEAPEEGSTLEISPMVL